MHHAFVIEADAGEGGAVAQAWIKQELGLLVQANPDVIVLTYGLLSVAGARKISELAAGAPFLGGHKVILISASRASHEAQNALLKLFEEPPPNTYFFLIMPSLGGLLPTLRSRVQTLESRYGYRTSVIAEAATTFFKSSKEKRKAIIKKLSSGKDDDQRRENREEAIAILNGVEAFLYAKYGLTKSVDIDALLSDSAVLRGYLYDRSAPVRMILEHLSLVIPNDVR